MKPFLPAALFLALLCCAHATRADTIYVTYSDTNTVEKFADDGTDLGAFATTGADNTTFGIASDTKGNIYVSIWFRECIEKYSPDGTDLGVFAGSGLRAPGALAFDANGNLCCSNVHGTPLVKFSPAGVNLGSYGSTNNGGGYVAVDLSGNLFVSSGLWANVEKYSSAGVDLGSVGSFSDSFTAPAGLAIAPNGNLYVAADGQNRISNSAIMIFSPTGASLGQLTVSGLSGPSGLAFDSSGNLYICNSGDNTIRKVSAAGVDLGIFAHTTGSPTCILVQASPTVPVIRGDPLPVAVVAGSNATFTVNVFSNSTLNLRWQVSTDNGSTWSNLTDSGNISGSTTANLSLANTTVPMSGQEFRAVATNAFGSATSNPANLTVVSTTAATTNLFYVAYAGNNTIEKFTSDGVDLGPFATAGLNGPEGMAFDAQGNLYVVNTSNNTIERFSSSGVNLGVFASNNLHNPVAIACDSSGNFYVTNYGTSTVEKFSATGADLGIFSNTPDTPWDLAFDTSGNLYVTIAFGTSSVHKYSSMGGDLGLFAASGLSIARGLAFNAQGNLYVVSQSGNKIQIYSPTGTNLGQVAVTGLNQPAGLFFDSGGNLFICDTNNNQIHKVSPAGVDLGVFANTGNGSSPAFIIASPQPSAPGFIQQPASIIVTAGTIANFSVAASGFPGPSYQWQISLNGGSTWSNLTDSGNISGSATAVLSLSNLTAVMSGDQFRAVATNPSGTAASQAASLMVNTPPVITTQPGNQTVIAGNSTSFTIAASGAPAPTAQWQISTNGGLTWANLTDAGNLSGSATPTLSLSNTTSAMLGYQFRALATNSFGVGTSSAATLTVESAPVIITQPGIQTVLAGSSTSFTAAANGYPLPSYHWQISADNGLTWSNLTDGANITGSATGTLSVSNIVTALPSSQFRVVAANLIASATSNVATLTVYSPPIFTTQPANLTVTAGNPATFTINASGAPLPSLQWQISTDGDSTWSNLTDGANVSGSTSATLSLTNTTATMLGNLFRAVVTNVAGTNITTAATLTVDTRPAITTQPGDQSIIVGNSTIFSAVASGYPAPAIHWQISTNGGLTWSNLLDGPNFSGTATASLSVNGATALMLGNQFRAVASNSAGSSTTNPASLTVNFAPVITHHPADQIVIAGNATAFSVIASASPAAAFQWQLSTDHGVSWTDLTDNDTFSGTASSTLSVSNTTFAMLDDLFRVFVSNSIGNETSDSATLTVYTPPVVLTQPGNQTVVAGNPAIFSVAADSYPAPAFLWQISTDAGLTWSDLADGAKYSNTTTAALSISNSTALMLGNQFRVKVANAAGNQTSTAASLNVHFPPTITAQPVNVVILSGNTATFTIAATGNPSPNFQWLFNNKVIAVGATAATLTIANVTAAKVGNYTVVVSNGIGSSVTSTVATLVLGVPPKITASPASVTVALGQNATFHVAASGVLAPAFQWQISTDGGFGWSNLTADANYSGVTSANLTVNATTTGLSGCQYRALAINAFNTVSSKSATLTLTLPPAITGLSLGNVSILGGGHASIALGGNLTLSVTASGTAPKYQWRLNGKNILGATKSTYSVARLAAAQAGTYTVVVSNALNSVTSGSFTLTVLIPPLITTQPKAQMVKAGLSATFTVVASTTSATPLSYQWKFNGVALTDGPNTTGSTTPSLLLSSVTAAANAGTYQVVLTNVAGSLASASVKLTVKP